MNMNIKKSVLLILSLLVAVFPYGISPVLAAQVAQAPVKIVDIEAGLKTGPDSLRSKPSRRSKPRLHQTNQANYQPP